MFWEVPKVDFVASMKLMSTRKTMKMPCLRAMPSAAVLAACSDLITRDSAPVPRHL